MRRALAITLLASTLLHASSGYAIDSYRYLHVSIETPWMIFLFLLVAVFVPFVLMVVLMWRGAARKADAESKSRDHAD
ncbi:MAG: hypothetical protein ABSF94_02475 [Steroidobacteraceae bacterium]|jgi:hypothetical protein